MVPLLPLFYSAFYFSLKHGFIQFTYRQILFLWKPILLCHFPPKLWDLAHVQNTKIKGPLSGTLSSFWIKLVQNLIPGSKVSQCEFLNMVRASCTSYYSAMFDQCSLWRVTTWPTWINKSSLASIALQLVGCLLWVERNIKPICVVYVWKTGKAIIPCPGIPSTYCYHWSRTVRYYMRNLRRILVIHEYLNFRWNFISDLPTQHPSRYNHHR